MARKVAVVTFLIASFGVASAQSLSRSAADESPMGRYAVEVRSKVFSTLNGVPWQGQGACSVELLQLPGGTVTQVTLLRCDFPEAIQAQVVEKLQSATLPYEGFEPVFQRKIVINLKQAPHSR